MGNDGLIALGIILYLIGGIMVVVGAVSRKKSAFAYMGAGTTVMLIGLGILSYQGAL